jgi:hypothetical protein
MTPAKWIAYYESMAERRLAAARFYLALAECYRRGFDEASMAAKDRASEAMDATREPTMEGEAPCQP